MKKIFTLVAVACMAWSANAETEVWKAADYDLNNAVLTTLTKDIYAGGDQTAPDKTKPGELKSSTITVSTTSVTMTGESTPHADKTIVTAASAWELKGSVDGNDALITDDCNPKFAKYLMGQGNPCQSYWYYWEENSDGDLVFKYNGVYWEPGMDMPAMGNYWKFDTKASGSIKVAIFGNKNGNPTYIVNAETKQPLPYNDIDVAIYYQNTGFAYEGNAEEGTAKYFNVGKMPEDYVLQHVNGITQNRPVLGFVTFPVEAGKTYYLFNPKSQIGMYGFEFTATGGTGGIDDVIANDENAPVEYFNLQGVRVENPQPGIYVKRQGNKVSKVVIR